MLNAELEQALAEYREAKAEIEAANAACEAINAASQRAWNERRQAIERYSAAQDKLLKAAGRQDG